MSRYVDADRFEKWLSVKLSEGLIDLKIAESVASVLKYAPTVDVKEIVHGEWKCSDGREKFIYNDWKCSICGFTNDIANKTLIDKDYHYCPCCGAMMDGGKHNE